MKQIELIGPPLYQWDTGRRVHIALQGVTEAHFAVAGCFKVYQYSTSA